MYTILDNITYELIIKNSKFITILYKIDTEDITPIMDELKKTYPDATHYTYAYIIGSIKRANDDGEPSGTAGIPILKVLESNNLTNVLCVVIRYFGGIKLGANGLIRAYTKSASNCVKEATIKELIEGVNIELTFPYEKVKEVDYLLKDVKINHKEFAKDITYNIDIATSFLETINSKHLEYKIIKNIKIKK